MNLLQKSVSFLELFCVRSYSLYSVLHISFDCHFRFVLLLCEVSVTELPFVWPSQIQKTVIEVEAFCVAGNLGTVAVLVSGIGKAAFAVQKVGDSLDAGTEFRLELKAGLKRDHCRLILKWK